MSAGETISDSLVIRPGRKLRYLYVLQAIADGLTTREADKRFRVGDEERAFLRRTTEALEEIPEELKAELHAKKQTYYPDESLDFPFELNRDEAWLAAEAIWANSYAQRAGNDGRLREEDHQSSIAFASLGIFIRYAGRGN